MNYDDLLYSYKIWTNVKLAHGLNKKYFFLKVLINETAGWFAHTSANRNFIYGIADSNERR